MEKAKKRGRPRTFQREETIELAMDTYWQEGLHSLSVSEICRRAKMSKPSMYREFGGEDGLLDAVLEHYAATVIAPMAELISANRSFAENMKSLIDFVTSSARHHRGCLFVKMRNSLERVGPQTRARIDALTLRVRQAYENLYSRARSLGEVRDDVSPQLAARYIDTQVSLSLHLVATTDRPDNVRAMGLMAMDALLVR